MKRVVQSSDISVERYLRNFFQIKPNFANQSNLFVAFFSSRVRAGAGAKHSKQRSLLLVTRVGFSDSGPTLYLRSLLKESAFRTTESFNDQNYSSGS